VKAETWTGNERALGRFDPPDYPTPYVVHIT